MRNVPDWWIQTSWWASGIFGTGAVWYFLSTHEYSLSIAAGLAAAILAILAILPQRKQDALRLIEPSPPSPRVPEEKDKVATTAWWEASDLRREYVDRGISR